MATIGLSKVFILDKYFTELQKFWETERKVQGKQSETRRGGPLLMAQRLVTNVQRLQRGKNVRLAPINGKSVGGEGGTSRIPGLLSMN